jgi:hypothetical protein
MTEPWFLPAQNGNSIANTIPGELEKVLWDLSYEVPVCIISSKDYYFLKDKVKFSKILSCIMRIEIINKKITKENEKSNANDLKSTSKEERSGCYFKSQERAQNCAYPKKNKLNSLHYRPPDIRKQGIGKISPDDSKTIKIKYFYGLLYIAF